MTTIHRHPGKDLGDNVAEQEWFLQERALEDQRFDRDPAAASARLLRYRVLSKRLRELPEAQLPVDFARVDASRIEAMAGQRKRAGLRFERRLVAVSAAVCGSLAAVAMAAYGRDGWASLIASSASMSALSNPWLLALLGCMGASRVLERTRRHKES